MKDTALKILQDFVKTGKWLPDLKPLHRNYALAEKEKLFRDKNFVWVRLRNYNYPRTALYLPEQYQKEAIYKAHYGVFGRHNANQKTYLKIPSSYFWPRIYQNIKNHIKCCLKCQQIFLLRNPTPLKPLPIPDRLNLRIGADLFGPMITAKSTKNFIFCITDVFTKYALVTAIANKYAETVADTIY